MYFFSSPSPYKRITGTGTLIRYKQTNKRTCPYDSK